MSKISELSDGGVIQGGDTLIAVRSGGNVKVTYGGSTTANIDGGTIDGTVIGGSTAAAITGTTITGTSFVSSGDMTFGDSDKAIFGAGSDLQIYHDGSNSYVQDAGDGALILNTTNGGGVYVYSAGETMATFNSNGAVNLYYDNAAKLATTATGIDVTGTVTADGLAVAVSDAALAASIGTDAQRVYITPNGTVINYNASGDSAGSHLFQTGNVNRLNIASNGDISFYEDTGTTAKFFWDASAESLGIGTTSPTSGGGLTLSSSTTAQGFIDFKNTVDGDSGFIGNAKALVTGGTTNQLGVRGGTSGIAFSVASAEAMRIDSSGNVGINVSSPTSPLHVRSAANVNVRFDDSGSSSYTWYMNDAQNLYIPNVQLASTHTFYANGQRKVDIDASGNLLVGKTSTSGGIAGTVLASSGLVRLTADGIAVAEINRLTSDGAIVDFKKDGTTVGVVNVTSGSIIFGRGDTALGFNDALDAVYPMDTNGTNRDNAIDLGRSSVRFNDIYATNGTIQTSDRNEKQDIEALSDAEQRVAVACKGLLRKFRWKSAVEEKGDDARIHFGIIAQDLQAAFEAEGLDAGRYAMFISSTWTDEETGEERSRMGVRYSELLAFIIAAI
jgi:hypothetical protein